MTKKMFFAASAAVLAALSSETRAMPAAPMLSLTEACPTCAPAKHAERRVVLHPAFGPVVENALPDWAEIFGALLVHYEARGEFARRQRSAAQSVLDWAENPQTSAFLPEAERHERTVRLYAPAVRDAIARDAGGIRGLTKNFRRTFLLIDASDPRQLSWAKRRADENETDARIVLLQGSLKAAREALPHERLWFDQGGGLRRRLGVKALPAIAELFADRFEVELLPKDFQP